MKVKETCTLLRISAFQAFTAFGSIVSLKLFSGNCLTCFKGGLVICQSEDCLVFRR